MVYLGYDFNPGELRDLTKEASSVQQSLSAQRLTNAKTFLRLVADFIADNLKLCREGSELSKSTVGISVMENFTGKPGFPTTEEKQAFHSDYPPSPSKNVISYVPSMIM